jgi:hypothetical protein
MPNFSQMSDEDIFFYLENKDSCLTREVLFEKHSDLILERNAKKLQSKLVSKILAISNDISSFKEGTATYIKMEGKPFTELFEENLF